MTQFKQTGTREKNCSTAIDEYVHSIKIIVSNFKHSSGRRVLLR